MNEDYVEEYISFLENTIEVYYAYICAIEKVLPDDLKEMIYNVR